MPGVPAACWRLFSQPCEGGAEGIRLASPLRLDAAARPLGHDEEDLLERVFEHRLLLLAFSWLAPAERRLPRPGR